VARGGGTIPEMVIYNHQQPTLDSEAQRVVQGNPDGWLFIDFCPTFEKLALPMTRTGKWDPAKSFGSDTLNDCASKGSRNYPGDARDAGERIVGLVVPGVQGALREEREAGRQVPVVHRRIVRLRIHRAARGDRRQVVRSREAQREVVNVTNDPGESYTYEQLDKAIQALLAGKKIHFQGATGPDQLRGEWRITRRTTTSGSTRPTAAASVVKTITFKP
jgi:branched-chain amino acid transport system substrate-binding protein